MGCGQSHIAVIYPRKAKGKSSGSGGSEESDEECGGDEGGGGGDQSGSSAGGQTQTGTDNQAQEDEAAKLRQQMVQISSSPLLQQAELSGSQYDFFKMLDEKINNGPDYQPNCEFEFTLDQTRLCRLIQEWQMAKQKAAWGQQAKHHLQSQQHHQQQAQSQQSRKLHRYHSLQSNGDIRQKQQYLYGQQPPPPYTGQQYQYQYQPQYQYPQQYQYPPVGGQYPPYPQYPQHYQLSNSVVLFDRSRGGYYTELA